ncbi:hypothetical protein ACXO2V_09155, partial [Lactobacillus delbrueckii subsp. bulgaricus]
GCILGAAANGKVMWLYPDGTTLKAVAPSSGTYSANEPTLLHLAGKKAQAKGYLKDDGSFVVLKGSTSCSEETKSCPGFLKKRRAELLNLK